MNALHVSQYFLQSESCMTLNSLLKMGVKNIKMSFQKYIGSSKVHIFTANAIKIKRKIISSIILIEFSPTKGLKNK